jgi:hypothetical protein
MMRDLKKMAEQQHKLEVAAGRALPDGTRIRTADGTPILPRRYNNKGQLVDNWGNRIRGKNLGPIPGNGGMKPDPSWAGNYRSDPLIRFYINFSRRLFCGAECSTANAPTSADAKTTPQLSDARIARNAVSQALAARSLVKFLGKVGVLIDEGFDGLIRQLMPDDISEGMGTKPLTLDEKIANAQSAYDNAVQDLNEANARFVGAQLALFNSDPSNSEVYAALFINVLEERRLQDHFNSVVERTRKRLEKLQSQR